MTFKTTFVIAIACLWGAVVHAAPEDASSTRVERPGVVVPWEAEFAAFAKADAANPPPVDGVLFVGSSSIRLWSDLEQQFNGRKVVLKRGFGGSQLSDCVQNLNRLVMRYRPRTVLVYAGDNDPAAGASPSQVRQRFADFAEGVHRELPNTRIAYISIKPSPSRAALLPEIRATNAMIREFASEHRNVAFIDVFTPMMDAAGAPRRELFVDDALHLNRAGYALWKTLVDPYVL